MAGPIEFTATEIAAILAILGLVPPFVIAVFGYAIHAWVLQRRREPVKHLNLFLKWWGWSTLGWIGAWLIAAAGAGA